MTTVATAKVEQMGQTFTIQMTSKAKSPDMGLIEIKIAEMGMVVEKTVYNNGKGLSTNMQTGKKNLEGEDLEKGREQSMLDKAVKLQDLGYSMKLMSIEEINGKDAYKVQVTSKNGQIKNVYYDAETKLKVYVTSQETGPDGSETQASQEFADYKDVDGIQYPHKMLIVNGDQEMEFVVSKIEINGKINSDEFKLE
jgi:hypothetical protein